VCNTSGCVIAVNEDSSTQVRRAHYAFRWDTCLGSFNHFINASLGFLMYWCLILGTLLPSVLIITMRAARIKLSEGALKVLNHIFRHLFNELDYYLLFVSLFLLVNLRLVLNIFITIFFFCFCGVLLLVQETLEHICLSKMN